jgi:anti-sigma B factor antagonist
VNIDVYMKITFRDLGKHKVIQVSGDIYLYHVSTLKKAIFSMTDGSHHSVIIDLKNIRYMDSSGVGILMAGVMKMREHKGTLALLTPDKDVLDIIKLAMMDKFFQIYWSEDEILN